MRLSPGWFNHRNSGVWWNCLRSAVSIIDTSAERHSHSVLFGRSLTSHLAVASLKKIWQANQPIRRSVEKITSADFILEIDPKGHQAGKISPPRSSGEPQPHLQRFARIEPDASDMNLTSVDYPPAEQRSPTPHRSEPPPVQVSVR